MLFHYFKIAFRSLRKRAGMSLVNMGGLAIGLVTSLFIVLFVANEYSFDRFHEHGDRIVKVEFDHTDAEASYSVPWMSYGFGQKVKEQCAEVEDFGRITDVTFYSKLVASDEAHRYYESNFVAADPGFLRLFSFKLIKGDRRTALTQPGTVILTESTARKYFGEADPLGKTITYDKSAVYQVVGVMEDLPANSSIQFDFLADLQTHRANELREMAGYLDKKTLKTQTTSIGAVGSYNTYFLIKNNASAKAVEAKIPLLLSESLKIRDKKDSYHLYTLHGLHFGLIDLSARQTTVIFSVIGLLILALALVNYVNLTTAYSSTRSGEVSVRKVVGGARSSLIFQFYLESFLSVTIAFLAAILLLFFSFQTVHTALSIEVDIDFLKSLWFVVPVLAFYLLSIVLAGSYPALLLSGFSPGDALRGNLVILGNAARARNFLTVFQFTISIVLIISSILIFKQMQFFKKKDLGIARDQIVTVFLDHQDGMSKHYKAIRSEVERLSGVDAVTSSSLLMYHPYGNSFEIKQANSDKKITVNSFRVDESFVSTMQISWAAGPRKDAPTNGLVLNESAARELGLHAADFRQTLDLGQGVRKDVVGIVKDFHFTSLRQKVKPMALMLGSDTLFNDYMYIKINKSADMKTTLAGVEQVYNRFKTNRPFEYTFLDDTYGKMYETEVLTGHVVYWITMVSVLIACLGLFGLTTFAAQQRRKEIGIRKVLGATVLNIVIMLSKDFVKLVVLSFLLASPLAHYAMEKWLGDFAYRIPVSPWVFVFAGAGALLLALITISFQGVKAAIANPVKSLKSD
ncbi:ABC transporter permease [Dyadobacter crusticola]|uniref:ABC transporter permease n=1 Tax=Dyadobacter crusticola TaxID=292407 RepID=UPI00146FA221|nr:ABC transporter permease [Dyadobacter crusticola]